MLVCRLSTKAGYLCSLFLFFILSACAGTDFSNTEYTSRALKLRLHQECWQLMVFPPLRRQGVGCPAETGRRKGGCLGIFFVLASQYSTQLEKDARLLARKEELDGLKPERWGFLL